MKGPGDPTRVVIVVEGHFVTHQGPGIQASPLAGRDSDLGECLPRSLLAELVHVAAARQAIGNRWTDDAVRDLELRHRRWYAAKPSDLARPHARASPCLPMGDER